jgi:DNA-binding transcriptional MerR regulator
MPYTPTQVSKLIGISVQSVRNWTREYAVLLSPEARGDNGQRLFGDEDLETMRTIAALRSSGMSPAEIIRRMQDCAVPPIVDVAQESPQPITTEAHTGPQEGPGTALALQAAYTSLVGRLDTLERRLDAQASEARTRAGMFAVGVITGIFLVMVLFLIANQLLGSG